jgi:AraC family transcriptional regulator
MIEPIRFEKGEAMQCVGIRRTHAYVEAVAGIQQQWKDMAALGRIDGAVGDTLYGIMCGADENGFEYMCGAQVPDFSDAHAALGRIRIPAQDYAVFTVPDTSAMAQTWLAIWQEWIPRSEYEMAHTPEFERYADGFATTAESPRVEIWASIKKAVDRSQ